MASLVILAGCACNTANSGAEQPLRSSSTQNAGPTWNSFAAAYSFATYPQSVNTTFEMAYSGNDFEADFGAILHQVAQALVTELPPTNGTDLLNATLATWPE